MDLCVAASLNWEDKRSLHFQSERFLVTGTDRLRWGGHSEFEVVFICRDRSYFIIVTVREGSILYACTGLHEFVY